MIRLGEDSRHRSVVFLLLDRFTMMAFASAIEPLRLANQVSGRMLYSWKLASEDGADVACSNGTVFRTDIGLEELGRDTMVLVCGGIDVVEAVTKPVLSWLRREARRGSVMGGLCTGSYALAKAGLLDGKRATIHWENTDSF
ncbi:MAG: AraC family transcriptional regulator, partial [Clostridia bacterium]|nr:AraC family transcriptional regulator [Clostridia bacterium]